MTLTTPPKISRIATIEITGKIFTTPLTRSPKRLLTIIPSRIGKMTTCTIDSIMSKNETSTHASAKIHVNSGVTIGAKIVDAIEAETLKAKSPFAR